MDSYVFFSREDMRERFRVSMGSVYDNISKVIPEKYQELLGITKEVFTDPSVQVNGRLHALGELLTNNGYGGPGSIINTFPFGIKPSPPSPFYLGCCEGADEDIADVWKDADRQCKLMIKEFPNEEKTILIMTDKWNDPKFQSKYAGKFISYAIHHNIVFIFLLVIPAGMSVIPFLPLDRDDLNRIGETMTKEEQKEKPVSKIFAEIVYGKAIGLNDYLECNYTEFNRFGTKIYYNCVFDFDNNVLTNCVNGDKYNLKTKKGQTFINALIDFIKLPDEQIVAIKNPTNIFEIHGRNVSKTIQWNATNRVLYAAFEKAINDFFKIK